MLKITTHIDPDTDVTTFSLEGRLAGPWVTELEQCWKGSPVTRGKQNLRVDLTDVTYIDSEGKTLLARLYRRGAKLLAAGCLTKCIVEEIMRAGPYERSSSECENESAPNIPDASRKKRRKQP
jgi:ABC-type transporter Mla MlaB component